MKIIIRPAFWLYVCMVALRSSWITCAAVVFALAVHEMGHYLAIKALREGVDRIEISPFGGVMSYRAGKCPSKGIKGAMIALAGPLGNYLAVLLMNCVPKNLAEEWIRAAMTSNLSMMIFNLLPVLPLDGGSVLLSIGFFLFDVSVLIRFLAGTGMAVGALLLVLGVYGGIAYCVLNLSVFMIGGYLIYAARIQQEQLLASHWYAILREIEDREMQGVYPLRLYRAEPQRPAMELLRYMGAGHKTAFVVEMDGDRFVLDDAMLCRALQKSPAQTVSEVLKNNVRKSILCLETLRGVR